MNHSYRTCSAAVPCRFGRDAAPNTWKIAWKWVLLQLGTLTQFDSENTKPNGKRGKNVNDQIACSWELEAPLENHLPADHDPTPVSVFW